MKMMKRIVVLLTVVLSLGLFAGCGQKMDASAYVKALLDNSYKNDASGILEQKIGTKEEAATLYEQGLDAEMSGLLTGVSLSEELQSEYRTVFAQILGKADYTVGEAEKQSDGSYVVTVNYKQLKVFGPAVTAWMAEAEALQAQWSDPEAEIPDENEMMETIYLSLKDCILDVLPTVEYGEEETTTIRVEKTNNMYAPNQEDLYNLEVLLFDIEAFNF